MKKLASALALSLALSLSVLAPSASAQTPSAPVGSCPVGFQLVLEHDHMMDHRHVGPGFDLNGSDYICVRHVTETLHVHLDDIVITP